jgi:hypothetical protein
LGAAAWADAASARPAIAPAIAVARSIAFSYTEPAGEVPGDELRSVLSGSRPYESVELSEHHKIGAEPSALDASDTEEREARLLGRQYL